MESYVLDGSATLSQVHGETTDNLIFSAIEKLPASAVAEIMPVVKTKGPTSQWVEPWYTKDKFEMVSTSVSMFEEHNTRKHLEISANAVDDIRRMYSDEAFQKSIQNWILFNKNNIQRSVLIKLLKSAEVDSIPADANIPNLKQPLVEDDSKIIQTRILQVINDLTKDFQLSSKEHFSVVAPYELGYALTQLQLTLRERLHILYDDDISKVYVFPTGSNRLDRAGLAIFEYADEIQKAINPQTGDYNYWVYCRSNIIANPVHKKHPIIRNISIG